MGIDGLAMDVLVGSGPGGSFGSRCNGLVNRFPSQGDLALSGRASVVGRSSGIRADCLVRNRKSYLRSGGAPAEDMGPVGPLHLLLDCALRRAPLAAADRKWARRALQPSGGSAFVGTFHLRGGGHDFGRSPFGP